MIVTHSRAFIIWFITLFSYHVGYALQLIDFKQDTKATSLYFDTEPVEASVVFLSSVPETLRPAELKKKSIQLKIEQKKLSIPIQKRNEPTQNEYSIILFVDGDWLELVRQSSTWLKNSFNFTKSGGYTILGRRSIEASSNPINPLPSVFPLNFQGTPNLPEIKPIGKSEYLEVNLAKALLRYLWSKPIKSGPTSLSYDEFLTKSFAQKLAMIHEGKFSVMCQGFRDMFIHASFGVPRLKVRAIEALNYSPLFKDLIPYGHSTAEIWIEPLKKWVIFDPWYGIMVTKKINGEPVGAFELQKQKKHPEHFKIVPVILKIPRFYNSHDNIVQYNFYPKSVQISNFKCKQQGCSPGYIEYFNNLAIHKVIISPTIQ